MILNWFFIYILIRLFNYLFMNLFHAATAKKLQRRYKPKVGKWILKILKDAPDSEGESKVKKVKIAKRDHVSFFVRFVIFLRKKCFSGYQKIFEPGKEFSKVPFFQ